MKRIMFRLAPVYSAVFIFFSIQFIISLFDNILTVVADTSCLHLFSDGKHKWGSKAINLLSRLYIIEEYEQSNSLPIHPYYGSVYAKTL
jgi:hypothetical protein